MAEEVEQIKTFTIALKYTPTLFSFSILNQASLETIGAQEGTDPQVKLRVHNLGNGDIEICCTLFEGTGTGGAVIDRSPEGCISWINIAPGTYVDVTGLYAKNMPANDRTVTVQVEAKPKGWI